MSTSDETHPQQHQQPLGHMLMICGDQSGIGKTSTCIGILNALTNIYQANEIVYIKPCTQCEGVQLLWKFCNLMNIKCHGIGPIVYRAGFTQECIDGKHGSAQDRLNLVNDTILQLRQQYKFILIDGVGYPGVGSCIGCSNRDVALRLGCPIMMVSRPGMFSSLLVFIYYFLFLLFFCICFIFKSSFNPFFDCYCSYKYTSLRWTFINMIFSFLLSRNRSHFSLLFSSFDQLFNYIPHT